MISVLVNYNEPAKNLCWTISNWILCVLKWAERSVWIVHNQGSESLFCSF